MNDALLAQELAAAFILDAPLAALFTAPSSEPAAAPVVNIYGQQSGFIQTRPVLSIFGEYQSYGPRRMGTVSFEVRSNMGEAGNHAAAFGAVFEKLFGEVGADDAATRANLAAARAAVIAAVGARSSAEIIAFGPAPGDTVIADGENGDLRTVITARVVWRFKAEV